jgi:protein O-GlcNAc transferase
MAEGFFLFGIMKKGKDLIALKKYNEAEVFFQNYAKNSTSAEIYLYLGISQYEQQKFSDAEGSLLKSFSLQKKNKICIKLLINCLIKLNRDLEAIDLLMEYLEDNDEDLELKMVLVKICIKIKNYRKAKEILDILIENGCINSGLCLNKIAIEINLKNYKEALSFSKYSLNLYPTDKRIISNYAALLSMLGEKKIALKYYLMLATLDDEDLTAHYNAVFIYRDMGDNESACKLLIKVLNKNPGDINARVLLINSSLKVYYWDVLLENPFENINSYLNELSVSPFNILSITENAAELYLATSQYDKYLRKYNSNYESFSEKNNKIKIAYISSDFRNHPTSILISSLFENHNKNKFEIHAISLCEPKYYDEFTLRIKNSTSEFIDISNLTDSAAIELLRSKNYDFAIDLNGHTKGNRLDLFRSRISKHQINFLGYPGSMGGGAHDYIIGDEILIPKNLEKFYSEKIIKMPDCYQPIDTEKIYKKISIHRADYAIPENSFVFCCFNASFKLNPTIFSAWITILKKSPNSILWILSSGEVADNRILLYAKSLNIDSKRIYFKKKSSYDEYLAQYRLADLFLDTFPFNAGTTASDALWMGLPLLTRRGETFASRMASSLLTEVGLQNFITTNTDDYINLAVRCSLEVDYYKKIKLKLKSHIEINKHYRMKNYALEFENQLKKILIDDKHEE